ncbi:MAG: DnaD domain protein [Firmicutes bacterium]|nr:DnaD domain protein [Bacillota bacterium]
MEVLKTVEERVLAVPAEIIEVYQPEVGALAVVLWINFRWLSRHQPDTQMPELIHLFARLTGARPLDIVKALDSLCLYDLLEQDGEGYRLLEPLAAEDFARRFRRDDSQVDGLAPDEHMAQEAVFAGQSIDGAAGSFSEAPPEVAALCGRAPDGVPVLTPVAPRRESGHVQSKPGLGRSVSDQPGRSLVPDRRVSSLCPRLRAQTPPKVGPSSTRTATSQSQEELPPLDSVRTAKQELLKRLSQSREFQLEPRVADLEAVIDIYHRKIGALGPTQYEKLSFWVEEKQMSAEVVALAIDETVRNAASPRLNYLEAVLRNWHSEGVRTIEDLVKRRKVPRALSSGSLVALKGGSAPGGGQGTAGQEYEGAPNAEAYKRIDPEMVKKWKELYPDEF